MYIYTFRFIVRENIHSNSSFLFHSPVGAKNKISLYKLYIFAIIFANIKNYSYICTNNSKGNPSSL